MEQKRLMPVLVILLITSLLYTGTSLMINLTKTASLTGAVVGTTNVTVATSTTITLPTSNVDFGTMNPNEWNHTSDDAPAAFTVQNDGTVDVNLTIYASDLWTQQSNPSSYYTFAANTSSEGTCFITGESNMSFTNMPDTAGGLLAFLNNTNTCDSAEIELNVTVPSDEGEGAKGSDVTITASQA